MGEFEDNPIREPKTVVDPPGGWQHGFPALLREDYDKQLRDAGYKGKGLEMAKKHSRYWSYKE
jgi:hypothetical protein